MLPPSAKRIRQEEGSSAEKEFLEVGMEMMQRRSGGSAQTSERRFRSHFGVSPKVCAHVWENLLDIAILPTGAEQKHFLWGLMLMMLYVTESVNASMAGGVDESTFRQWAWLFVYEISFLESKVVCKCLFCSRRSHGLVTIS